MTNEFHILEESSTTQESMCCTTDCALYRCGTCRYWDKNDCPTVKRHKHNR